MKFLLQTSVNSLRQKEQAVIKQACQKAGIEVELKAVSASVFFSSDEANPDTNSKFYADMEIFALVWSSPDPHRAMDRFTSWEVASKANKWQGRNICRWVNAEFDALYRAAEQEMDPVKRAAMCIRMNDMAVNAQAVIPLIARAKVNGVSNKLVAPKSVWDIDFGQIQDWYKEA
jgi:peptide/nickel transport system substrate-binding protein